MAKTKQPGIIGIDRMRQLLCDAETIQQDINRLKLYISGCNGETGVTIKLVATNNSDLTERKFEFNPAELKTIKRMLTNRKNALASKLRNIETVANKLPKSSIKKEGMK